MGAYVIGGSAYTIGGSAYIIGVRSVATEFIQIDFGNDSPTPADWNDFNDTSATGTIANLFDSTTSLTGASITSGNTGIWGDNPFVGTPSVNAPDWPADVMSDNFNTFADKTLIIDFSGNSDFIGVEIELTLWAADASTDSTRKGNYSLKLSGGGTEDGPTEFDAANDGLQPPITLTATVPLDGILELFCEVNTRFYIAGIVLGYTLPTGSPTLTTPYSMVQSIVRSFIGSPVN